MEGQSNLQRKAILIAVTITLIFAGYVGCYFGTVEACITTETVLHSRAPGGGTDITRVIAITPFYSIGEEWPTTVFGPIHSIDRLFRSDKWKADP